MHFLSPGLDGMQITRRNGTAKIAWNPASAHIAYTRRTIIEIILPSPNKIVPKVSGMMKQHFQLEASSCDLLIHILLSSIL